MLVLLLLLLLGACCFRDRYADVVVHRLLAAAIGIAPLPDDLRDQELLHDCSGRGGGVEGLWTKKMWVGREHKLLM